MVTYRKRLPRRAAGLLIAGAVLAVAACGGGNAAGGDTPSDQGAPAANGGQLVFGNWQWLEPGRGDVLWNGVGKYSEVNPKAKLVKESTPFSSYADKLNTELGAGGGPDLIVMLDSQFATLSQAGLLEPLDGVLGDAKLNNTNEAGKTKGKQLAVTWERINYALIWNKRVLAKAGVKPPTTVDELISAGKTIKAKTGVQGFGVRHRIAEFDGWFMDYANWTYGFGGSYVKDGKLALDAPENIEGVKAFKRVYDSGIMPIGDDMSTMRAKFAQGRLAMLIENGGGTEAAAATLGGAAIGSSALPFPHPGAHQQVLIGVNAHSKNKALAKDFIKWFVSAKGQKLSQPGHGPSTMATDIPPDPQFIAANPWAIVFPTLSADSRSPIIPGFETKTKPIMRNFLEAVERVDLQGADPGKALAEAQQKSQQ